MNYLNDLFKLKGKSVIVTGACGQLGKEICRAFVSCGAKVVGIDKSISPECKNSASISYYEADISNSEAVSVAFESINQQFGNIDILVNNAGVSTFEPFEERTNEQLDWVIGVNLKGTFFCIQSFVKMADRISQKSGAIVNVGSFYGVVSPDPRIYEQGDRKNSEIYGATKAGVIQITKYFAVHLADRNIRVNAVSPGGIYNPETPQASNFIDNYSYRCPMKRMAKTSEMVGAVLYLSSEAATYTNGLNMVIDGGMTCW